MSMSKAMALTLFVNVCQSATMKVVYVYVSRMGDVYRVYVLRNKCIY